MSKQNSNAKFLTDLKIEPKVVELPISRGSPDNRVVMSAKLFTDGRKVPIHYTITHPSGEEETNKQPQLAEEGHRTANTEMTYKIHHDRDPGTYNVIVKIQANCENMDDCIRKGSFLVIEKE